VSERAAGTPPPADIAPRQRLAQGFLDIAGDIEAGRPDAALCQRLQRARTLCGQAAAGERDASRRELLGHLQTALSTWQQVWPRLGGQQPFRLAVAREARLWAKRLAEG
jgi:hypothetical protein